MSASRQCVVLAICSTLTVLNKFFQRILPQGSLARHLVVRLFPAVLVLIAVDLCITWIMTQQMSLEEWLTREVLWTMVASQVLLIGVFTWILLAGVRSGLQSINDLARDITERSEHDLQPLDTTRLPSEVAPLVLHFNELLLRLDDAMQAQKRFIGHAAHQLRTPLTGLRLESELMLASDIPDDVRLRAERIKNVTDRMIRLGQQLLVLARADPSVRPQHAFIRLDLSDWARVTVYEWVSRARQQGIHLQLHAGDEPVMIDADPLLLEELLGNLIDNALRYAKQANLIQVSITANPPSLIVQDNGCGIVASDAVRVFEAFYRGADAAAGGSGLGLAIVREIARAHGAWWNLTSRPEYNGTRVVVVFPGPRMGTKLRRTHESFPH